MLQRNKSLHCSETIQYWYSRRKISYPCTSTMKMHNKVGVLPNTFIILTPDDDESSVSCPGHFNPVERAPITHRRGMGGPISVIYCRNQKNLCPCQKWNSLTVRLIT